MTDVKIVDPSGAETLLTHLESTVERDQNELPTSQIRVPRSEVNNATLDEADDEVYIREGGTDEFGGILKDVIRASGGSQGEVELVVENFERLAKDAEPAPPKKSYSDVSDATVVRDAVDGVPGLSKGTINPQESGVDILFHHATRALQIRMMRSFSGGEIRYNADKSVDYVASVGTDRSGTTISPSNQNITGLRKLTQSGGPHKTHLRVIGAGGTSVDVEADSFTGGRERWGRALFKSVANRDALRVLGKKLLEDLATRWTEVEADLVGLSPAPAIGDTYTVDYPEEEITSKELRIANLKTIRDERGTRWQARLSNRSFARSQQVDSPAQQAEEMGRTGQTSSMQNVISATFPTTLIAANRAVDQRLRIPRGGVFYLWSASVEPPRQNIKTQVIESPGRRDEKQFEADGAFTSGNPMLKLESPELPTEIALRLSNVTQEQVEASGIFTYTVERVQ